VTKYENHKNFKTLLRTGGLPTSILGEKKCLFVFFYCFKKVLQIF